MSHIGTGRLGQGQLVRSPTGGSSIARVVSLKLFAISTLAWPDSEHTTTGHFNIAALTRDIKIIGDESSQGVKVNKLSK